MAYVITINNRLYKIAANETDKNEHVSSYPPYVANEISDSDFTKVKSGVSTVVVSADGTISFEEDTSCVFENADELNQYLTWVKSCMAPFLNQSVNSSKAIYSEINTYKSLLDSFDTSSVSFPLNSSWEKYCEDNSIAYISPLQIP